MKVISQSEARLYLGNMVTPQTPGMYVSKASWDPEGKAQELLNMMTLTSVFQLKPELYGKDVPEKAGWSLERRQGKANNLITQENKKERSKKGGRKKGRAL